MNTRASTRTRLSVLPVAFALFFNLLAPVLSIAVPDAAPEVLQPQSAEASDDPATGTQFSLQGCRLEAGDFIEATTTCEEAAYTPGNLGKEWAELDLVPYRLTVGSPVDQTFTIALAADYKYFDDGSEYLGYDVIGGVVLNAALSEGDCAIATSGGNQFSGDDAAGGIDETIYQLVTITAGEDATCVFDLYMRLALGSHSFSGASLHAYTLEHDLDPLGERRVSIFVKEIAPQELSKVMSATRGAAFAWSIEKSSNPTSLNFADTCVPDAASRQATVSVTVSWERTGPTAAGDVTVTTTITATNPAERSIVISVEDRIYEGTGQTAQFGDTFTASATVPANSSKAWTHTVTGASDATEFNDVATATYTDLLTGVAVPGNTTATASATVELSTVGAAHESVTITDTESITGSGLTFSVDSSTGASGTFTTTGGAAYTLGTATTGPVNWTSGTQSASGSVTFNKTVYAAQGTTTSSGSLDDTATVLSGGLAIASANLGVGITSDASVSLTINKSIPAGSLRSGESVTFDFEVYAGTEATGTPVATDSITISYGALAGSTTVTGLDPGTYTVREVPQPNWAEHVDQTTTIDLPDCDGSVSFNNSTLAPDLSITKEADAATVNAGDDIGFSIVVSNDDEAGTGIATDVTLNDPLPGSLALGVDWTLDAVLFNDVAVTDPSAWCEITGAPPTETLECEFGDLDPGDSYEVQVSSGTSAPNGCENATLSNTATADASNHDEIQASATIVVECPDLDIDKTADAATVSAGEDIGFTITVTNSDAAGVGTATNVTIDDPLPGSLALGIDWSVDAVWLNGVEVGDPSAYCSITGDPPAQTLECAFGDLEPGDSAAVHVMSGTSGEGDCATANLQNEATADADNHGEVTASDSIVVECPGLNIVKTADADPIDAGEEASFTITVWNAGPGDAFDVTLLDTLPAGLAWDFEVLQGDADCAIASSLVNGGVEQRSIDCDLGDLAPVTQTSGLTEGVIIRVFADTTRDDCGLLENTAFADASNDDEVSSTDTLLVKCPTIGLEKENDAVGSVLPGTTVTYTLTLTVDDGPAEDVTVVDSLPVGLVNPTSISDGGVYDAVEHTITWDLGDLADGEYTLTYEATVADDVENGEELVNAAAATSTNSQCPDVDTLGPECIDDSTVVVRVPTLVIDKQTATTVITISGAPGAQVANPSVLTWTLTYTLTNGPVTNAVISDELPDGLVYVTGSASDGGVYDAATDTLTWTFPTLSGSGSVTFQTTVDVETISRVAPTVNVAVISSDQTPEDEGQDSVSVVVEPPPLGGNPTPTPRPLPDTAAGFGIDGEPVTVPVELLVAFFIGSLGAMALANVRAARSRRR